MKIFIFFILLFSLTEVSAQNLESKLKRRFINSIELNNQNIYNEFKIESDSILINYSKDSSIILISTGKPLSFEITDIRISTKKVSVFKNDKFYNIIGFEKSDINLLMNDLKRVNQETHFYLFFAKTFNIEILEMLHIFENWQNLAIQMNKDDNKLKRKFNLKSETSFNGEKIY